MPTFLNLCQEFVAELGIGNGVGPSTVEGQTGELANVVFWIANAAMEIELLWQDWKFLWTEYSGVLGTHSDAALNRFAPAPNSPAGVLVRRWDETSFWLEKQSGVAQPLHYVPWARFRQLYDVARNATLPAKPNTITIRPDNTLQLFPVPEPGSHYTLSGEFWRRAVRMRADGDVSAIPEEYQRIITCRAAVKYANKEDAPEIIQGMEAEYIDLLDKLQSDQLEAFGDDRRSGGCQALIGSIPGME